MVFERRKRRRQLERERGECRRNDHSHNSKSGYKILLPRRDSEGGDRATCYSKARQLQQRIPAVVLDDWEVLDALQECCLEGKGVSFVKEIAGGSLRKWRQWLQHNCAGNLVSSIRRD